MTDLALRARVAMKVTGVHVKHYNKHGDKSRPCTTVVIPHGVNAVDFCGTLTLHDLIKAVPAYETDIAAAWTVVERIGALIAKGKVSFAFAFNKFNEFALCGMHGETLSSQEAATWLCVTCLEIVEHGNPSLGEIFAKSREAFKDVDWKALDESERQRTIEEIDAEIEELQDRRAALEQK